MYYDIINEHLNISESLGYLILMIVGIYLGVLNGVHRLQNLIMMIQKIMKNGEHGNQENGRMQNVNPQNVHLRRSSRKRNPPKRYGFNNS